MTPEEQQPESLEKPMWDLKPKLNQPRFDRSPENREFAREPNTEESINVPLTGPDGKVIGRAKVFSNGQVSAYIGPERAQIWRDFFLSNLAVSIQIAPELIPARRPELPITPIYKKPVDFREESFKRERIGVWPTKEEWEESEGVLAGMGPFLDESRRLREERSMMDDSAYTFMEKARKLVRMYIEARLDKSDPPVDFTVYLVWFSKTLQNWKALVSSTLPDGMYYEVTYNGDKQETYIDAYKKVENVCVADTLEQTGFEILEF